MEIELAWWCMSPLGFVTHIELRARPCWHSMVALKKCKQNPNTWPWAALASIVLLPVSCSRGREGELLVRRCCIILT